MNYVHPGYKKPYPIATVLRDLASQEGCDGEPYDVMIAAAAEIARLTEERDRQYDENVARIAAQAKAEAERDAAMAGRVKVKPLVWSAYFDGYCLHTDTRIAAYSDAIAITGRYSVGRKHTYIKSTAPTERAFDNFLSSDWWVETPNRKILGPFNSDVKAKAAAQADFDAVTRSAQQPAPAPQAREITVQEAAEVPEVKALIEAASALAEQAAHVSLGARFPQVDISAAALNLVPLASNALRALAAMSGKV